MLFYFICSKEDCNTGFRPCLFKVNNAIWSWVYNFIIYIQLMPLFHTDYEFHESLRIDKFEDLWGFVEFWKYFLSNSWWPYSTQATNHTNRYKIMHFRIRGDSWRFVRIREDLWQIHSRFMVKPQTTKILNELRTLMNAYASIKIQLEYLRIHHKFVTN